MKYFRTIISPISISKGWKANQLILKMISLVIRIRIVQVKIQKKVNILKRRKSIPKSKSKRKLVLNKKKNKSRIKIKKIQRMIIMFEIAKMLKQSQMKSKQSILKNFNLQIQIVLQKKNKKLIRSLKASLFKISSS